MNWSAVLVELVPAAVVTFTSTVPADAAGEVAVQMVVLEQLTAVPAGVPKLTVLAPATKPVP